ncbi:MAG: hypothetical protein KatS3mg032_0675 [Cyclobacteriaceae bacterium]|nr:MAG: hypothetical protein KatS3mg032_0675 [Cyclobacteriaceae bacterium]
MSEIVLDAILQLFAVAARQDKVSRFEREQMRQFLLDHINEAKAEGYLKRFIGYSSNRGASLEEEKQTITKICQSLATEVTQRQKLIILVELFRIVLADEHLTEREMEMVKLVAQLFKITDADLEQLHSFLRAADHGDLNHENFLIISPSPPRDKTRHIARRHLNGFLAISYFPEVDLYFVKHLGRENVFLNGVPLRQGVVQVLPVGSTIRWDRDEPVYYVEVVNRFKQFSDKERITFEAKGLWYRFKNGKQGLRNINLAEQSGHLVAIMGASGSGKSTLLHVLNGSEKPSEGQVLINGVDIHRHPGKTEGLIGFVPQDDLLLEELTVYQNLYYAAKLCFGNKREEEIHNLVMQTLNDLGLAEIKDLKVGSPLQKTISGGQRKRLNMGLELLREPAVLFCDEPTSGLSSRDSENIIDLLKELTLKGKLVFAVIHQPSSDIFKKFDRLLILDTGGYPIYYGNPVDAVVYFRKSVNLIGSEEGECYACGNVNPEQIFNIIETRVINEYGAFTQERKISPMQWNALFEKSFRQPELIPATTLPKGTLNIPGRLRQAWLFARRDLESKFRNRQYMIINLLEAPLLAFILAFIVRYYNVDDRVFTGYVFAHNPNLPAYLFMGVIVALFMGLTVSAEEIIRDRKILKREAFLHLSRGSYLVAKTGILFTLSAIQTLTFVLVGSAVLELHDMTWQHVLILFTASCFANMLGLNISSAFNSAVTIYILIPLLIIPQLILSGVVVRFDRLNPAIGNVETVPFVGDLMASRWAFEAAMVTQFRDNPYERKFYPYDKIMAEADYKKLYYLPELETRLEYCLNNMHSADNATVKQTVKNMKLLYNELSREAEAVAYHAGWINRFKSASFDSALYYNATEFIQQLKQFYSRRYNQADEAREKLISSLTDTPEKAKEFENLKLNYHNEAIAEMVKNTTDPVRIVEKNGRLIQKIFPVYKDPDPDHIVDFDAQFYMARKHFLNQNVDTLFFNIGVIWSMTIVLAIALYFDLLRKILEGTDRLTNPVYKKS